jgi:tRNA nucleotidyltransferase (CCA-adding enzyme)
MKPAELAEYIGNEKLELLTRLGGMAAERGEKLCLVGGAMRDILLGRRGPDVDLTLEGDVLQFTSEAAAALGLECVAHKPFGTATLSSRTGLRVDVATARSETYTHPGVLPQIKPGTIQADLRRRDFTVNAIAMSLLPSNFGALYDPFGGERDIERRALRVLHAGSFIDDPTRILRGFRFTDRFSFDEETERLAHDAIEKRVFHTVSGVRIKKELKLIFETPERGKILENCRLFRIGNAIQSGFEFRAELLYPEDRVKFACDALFEGGAAEGTERWVAGLAAAAAGTPPEALSLFAGRIDATRTETEALLRTNETVAPRYAELLGGIDARPSDVVDLLSALPNEALVYLYAAGDKVQRVNITMYHRRLRHIRLEITGNDLIARGHKPSRRFSGVLREILRRKQDGLISTAEQELSAAENLLKEEN